MYIFEQKHVRPIQSSLSPALQNVESLFTVSSSLWSDLLGLWLAKKPKRKVLPAFSSLPLRPATRFGNRVAAFFTNSEEDILHHRYKNDPLDEKVSLGGVPFAHYRQTKHFLDLCSPQEAASCVIENSMSTPIKLNP